MASTKADLELKYHDGSLVQSATPINLKMMHPATQQPLRREDKTPQPRCRRVDNQLVDQSPNSSFPFALPRLAPFWDSLIKPKRWLTPALQSPRRLLPPQPSTLCNADNEDDKKREQLLPADEPDKASKVAKSLPHQSPTASSLLSGISLTN